MSRVSNLSVLNRCSWHRVDKRADAAPSASDLGIGDVDMDMSDSEDKQITEREQAHPPKPASIDDAKSETQTHEIKCLAQEPPVRKAEPILDEFGREIDPDAPRSPSPDRPR